MGTRARMGEHLNDSLKEFGLEKFEDGKVFKLHRQSYAYRTRA